MDFDSDAALQISGQSANELSIEKIQHRSMCSYVYFYTHKIVDFNVFFHKWAIYIFSSIISTLLYTFQHGFHFIYNKYNYLNFFLLPNTPKNTNILFYHWITHEVVKSIKLSILCLVYWCHIFFFPRSNGNKIFFLISSVNTILADWI